MAEDALRDRWLGFAQATLPQTTGKDATSEVQVYVGFLPASVDSARLSEMFAPFGEVISARIVEDFTTQRSKGYGFVSFAQRESAEKAAAQLHGQQLEGHSLVVRVSEENRTRFGTPGPVVYVKGIPVTYSEKNIQDVFEGYGPVEDVKILTDRETRLSRGVALVRFQATDIATRAIEGLNRRALPGSQRILVVRYADTQEEKDKRRDRRSTSLQRRYEPYNAAWAGSRYTSPGSGYLGYSAPASQPQMERYGPPGVTVPSAAAASGSGEYAGAAGGGSYGSYVEGSYGAAAMAPDAYSFGYGYGAGGYAAAYAAPQASHFSAPQGGGNLRSQGSSSGVSLFVYNVPSSADDTFLYKMFGPHGAITSVEIARNRADGTSRGFAFVNMVNQDDAYAAIRALNGQVVNGKSLQVSIKRAGAGRRAPAAPAPAPAQPPPPGFGLPHDGARERPPAAAEMPSASHRSDAADNARYSGVYSPPAPPKGAPR